MTHVGQMQKELSPILLTLVLAKILEIFVVTWMKDRALHSPSQYGAVKGSSTQQDWCISSMKSWKN